VRGLMRKRWEPDPTFRMVHMRRHAVAPCACNGSVGAGLASYRTPGTL